MVIGVILLVCFVQLLGFRHAALFLKKEIFKEDPTKTFDRLDRLTGISIAFPMSSTKRKQTLSFLKDAQKAGLLTQYRSSPLIILGFFLFFVGLLIAFNVNIHFIPSMSQWLGLGVFFLGIFCIAMGLKCAFPGMLKEFSAESAMIHLNKNNVSD